MNCSRLKTLILLLVSATSMASPVSIFDRFVCTDGLDLINKKYVVSFFKSKSFDEALTASEKVSEDLEKEVMDKDNVFFNKVHVGIIKNHQDDTFHVVDQVCYTNNSASSQASVAAIMFKNKYHYETQVLEAHTSRFTFTGVQQRDYLESVESFDVFQYEHETTD